jgi:hypothetical protein
LLRSCSSRSGRSASVSTRAHCIALPSQHYWGLQGRRTPSRRNAVRQLDTTLDQSPAVVWDVS